MNCCISILNCIPLNYAKSKNTNPNMEKNQYPDSIISKKIDIVVEQNFVLENLYFLSNTAVIQNDSYKYLNELAERLIKNLKLNIMIRYLFVMILFSFFACSPEIQKQNMRINQLETTVLEYRTKMLGKIAPDFRVTTLEGSQVELSKLRDKIVVLYISYTNIPHTNRELLSLNKIVEKYVQLPVNFFAIYCYDTPDKVKNSLKTFPLRFQQIANEPMIAKNYQFPKIYPMLMVIDKSQKIK